MEKYYLLFRENFYFSLVVLLILVPLYPKFPLENISGTYVAIRLEDVVIAIVVFLWFILNFTKILEFLKQTLTQAFILFWLIGILSILSGFLITYPFDLKLGFFHWLRRVEVMSLFLVAATTVKSFRQARFLLTTILVVTLIVIFYGFGQIFLNFPVISTTNREFSKGLILHLTQGARVNSTFAGHYDLAAYLSMVLCTLASLFFYFKKWFHKLWIILTGILGFVLLSLTAARVSFVAALIGITLSFWLVGKRLLIVFLIFVTLATIAAIPDLRHRLVATITVNLLGGGGPKYNPSSDKVNNFTPITKIPQSSRSAFLKRKDLLSTQSATSSSKIAVDVSPGEPVNSTELGVYRSFEIRLNVEWPRAVRSFMKNPFLGTGYSSLTLATDNDFLRSLGETGLLGTLSLMLIFYILFQKMFRFIGSESGFSRFFTIGIITSTTAILLTGTFIDVLEASKAAEIFWLMLGVCWALMKGFKDG